MQQIDMRFDNIVGEAFLTHPLPECAVEFKMIHMILSICLGFFLTE